MKIDRELIERTALESYYRKIKFKNDKNFKKDLHIFFIIRKMTRTFLSKSTINERLILNKIITSLNVFGIDAVNTIFRMICDDEEFSIIKSFLIFLNSYSLKNDRIIANHIILDILKDVKERYSHI